MVSFLTCLAERSIELTPRGGGAQRVAQFSPYPSVGTAFTLGYLARAAIALG